jgi:hypothetical protein
MQCIVHVCAGVCVIHLFLDPQLGLHRPGMLLGGGAEYFTELSGRPWTTNGLPHLVTVARYAPVEYLDRTISRYLPVSVPKCAFKLTVWRKSTHYYGVAE